MNFMNGNSKRQFNALSRFVLPFLLGICLAYNSSVHVSQFPLLAVLLFLVTASLLLHKRKLLSGLLLYITVFLLGFVRVATDRDAENDIPLGVKTDYVCVALDDAVCRGKTMRFDALVVELNGVDVKPFKAKISLLPTGGPMEIRSGMSFRCRSAFELPASNPASRFDYRRYLLVHGFKCQTFVYGSDAAPVSIYRLKVPLWYGIQIKMSHIRYRLAGVFTDNGLQGDNLAVVYAMTLGDRTLIDKSLRDAYSVVGASHILALSGLHLGIIYTLLLILLWRGNKLRWWRMFVQILILVSVWTYVMLVGMPLSAVRSALMISVASVMAVSGRVGQTLDGLAVAAVIVVVLSPLSIFDTGFQMSFLAVASILLLAEPLYRWVTPRRFRKNLLLRWLGGMTSVSLAAQIGVAPLTAYCFGRFSFCFLIANIVVLPLAMLLLYGALLLFVASCVPALQYVVALCLDSVSRLLNDVVTSLSYVPWASVENIRLSFLQLILCYVVLVALFSLFFYMDNHRFTAKSRYQYPDVSEVG